MKASERIAAIAKSIDGTSTEQQLLDVLRVVQAHEIVANVVIAKSVMVDGKFFFGGILDRDLDAAMHALITAEEGVVVMADAPACRALNADVAAAQRAVMNHDLLRRHVIDTVAELRGLTIEGDVGRRVDQLLSKLLTPPRFSK